MVNADLLRFISDIQISSNLKTKLAAMAGSTNAERAAALQALGYDVQPDDLDVGPGPLNDSQLDGVAGGGGAQIGRTLHNLWNEIWN